MSFANVLARPRRREKLFGFGRPRPLDREGKIRIMHLARALSRRTEPGRHYGAVTAKALAVLEALLWGFHNAKSGLCFPSYDKIAEAAGCARSTVHAAIVALEAAGLLTWCHRLARLREWAPGLPEGGANRVRVIRTSNGYQLIDPKPRTLGGSSKSDLPTGTTNQDLKPQKTALFFCLDIALSRLASACGASEGALREDRKLPSVAKLQ